MSERRNISYRATRKAASTVITTVVAFALLATTWIVGAVAANASEDSITITPNSGPSAGGQTVTIDGLDLGLPKFVDVSASTYHSLGLTADGSVYGWGGNSLGQLGDGTTDSSLTPVKVAEGEAVGVSFTKISAGMTYSLALGDDGNVYGWGNNFYGQLGDGTTSQRLTPTKVVDGEAAGTTFVEISASVFHTIALGADGNIYTWGDNEFHQLGVAGPLASSIPKRVTVPGNPQISQVGAGTYYSSALSTAGTIYTWGINNQKELGTGTTDSRPFPTAIAVGEAGGVSFTQLASGTYHSIALGNDGNIYSWGDNLFGQLGDDSTTARLSPVRVATGQTSGVSITGLDAGLDISVALGADGNAYTWGRNDKGQVGDGTETHRLTPVRVIEGEAVGVSFTSIGVSGNHVMVIGDDQNTYGWGSNTDGQLGDTTQINRTSPVKMRQFPIDYAVYFETMAYPGTDVEIIDQDAGTLQVTTPAHPAGTVDVFVEPVDALALSDSIGEYTFTDPVDMTGSVITANKTQALADGDDEIIATVTLQNSDGDPIGETGQDVTIYADTTPLTTTDNNDGTYSATLTSTIPTTITLSFTIDDTPGTNTINVTFRVEVTPEPPVLQDVACGIEPAVIIPEDLEGVLYQETREDSVITVVAEPDEGFTFPAGAETEWEFDVTPAECPSLPLPVTGGLGDHVFVIIAGLFLAATVIVFLVKRHRDAA